MFDFSIVTNWIHQMLTSLMPEGLAVFLECVVIGVCIILMYAVLARTEIQRKSAFSPLFLHIPLCRIQMQKKRIFFCIFLYAWIPLFSSPDSFTPNS